MIKQEHDGMLIIDIKCEEYEMGIPWYFMDEPEETPYEYGEDDDE